MKCLISEYFCKKNNISCEFEGNNRECLKGEYFDVCPVNSWAEKMGSRGLEDIKFGSLKGFKFENSIVHSQRIEATCGCESKFGVQICFCPEHNKKIDVKKIDIILELQPEDDMPKIISIYESEESNIDIGDPIYLNNNELIRVKKLIQLEEESGFKIRIIMAN